MTFHLLMGGSFPQSGDSSAPPVEGLQCGQVLRTAGNPSLPLHHDVMSQSSSQHKCANLEIIKLLQDFFLIRDRNSSEVVA